MDLWTASAWAGVLALVVAVAALFYYWRTERNRRKEVEEERQRKKREFIVDLIRSLNHHQVLSEEVDYLEEVDYTEEVDKDYLRRFYGTPTNMFAAVKEIRADIRAVQKVLGENHPDEKLLEKMARYCNEFAKKLEPYAVNKEFSSGGPAFAQKIREPHVEFQNKFYVQKTNWRIATDLIPR